MARRADREGSATWVSPPVQTLRELKRASRGFGRVIDQPFGVLGERLRRSTASGGARLEPVDVIGDHPGWPTKDHWLAWSKLRGQGAQPVRHGLALVADPLQRRWLRTTGLIVPAGKVGWSTCWVAVECCRKVAELLGPTTPPPGGWPCDCAGCGRGRRVRYGARS